MAPHRSSSVVISELLLLPAAHGAREIALRLLDDLRTSHARLSDGSPDGLHDLRVAARRLRTWLRAFRPVLADTVRGKTRRRLRALTSATNEARDAEVALAFIDGLGTMPRRMRIGARHLASRLEREIHEHGRGLHRVLERDLSRTAHSLTDQLAHYWERHDIGGRASPDSFAALLGDTLRGQMSRVDAALAQVSTVPRLSDLHRGRLAVKRLRYLLEPLGDTFGADQVVTQLQLMQRQLGEVRDGHRLAMRIVREIGERAARDARLRALASLALADEAGMGDEEGTANAWSELRPGLMEVARKARDAAEAALGSYREHWGDSQRATLMEDARKVSSALGAE